MSLAGIDRSNLRLGQPLVICGAGPIGIVTLLAAHAAGAAPIVITDLDDNRLAMAKRLVPRVRTVCVDRGDEAKSLGKKIVAALGSEAQLVLECTGVESSIHAAIYVSTYNKDYRGNFTVYSQVSRRLHSGPLFSLSVLGRTSRTSPSCTSHQRRSTFGSNIATMIPIRRQ